MSSNFSLVGVVVGNYYTSGEKFNNTFEKNKICVLLLKHLKCFNMYRNNNDDLITKYKSYLHFISTNDC